MDFATCLCLGLWPRKATVPLCHCRFPLFELLFHNQDVMSFQPSLDLLLPAIAPQS